MRALRFSLATLAILLTVGFAAAQQGQNLTGPQQKAEQEKAQHDESGRAGATEPSSHTPSAPPDESWVFWNGKLTAPGAPADSQTVPAKFSARNNSLDELPTMAFPLPLTDEQRRRIRDAVSKTPVEAANVQPADQLPSGINVRELSDQITSEIPAMRHLGYVRAEGRILLISPPSRIVMGEIPDQAPSK